MKNSSDHTSIKKIKSILKTEALKLTDAKKLQKITQDSLQSWTPLSKPIQGAKYQILDFFSGAGGMSLGFASLGRATGLIKVVGGLDIQPEAARTFQKNFGAPCILRDIRTLVTKHDIKNFLNQLPEYESKLPTIVIGCAPCQGFSSHRKKNWDKEDHRNSLVGIFSKVAVDLKPEMIVMENVPEMLSKKYWHEFELARETFTKAGYIVHQTIYNTAAFGVPQERFRALVVAMKKDFNLPDELLHNSQFKTVRDAIGNLPPVIAGEIHPNDPLHKSAKHSRTTLETIRAVPKNGGNRPTGVGPKCLDKVKGFYDVYGRLSWDKPSITITHYARNPASGRYTHPEQDRGLTAREAALLQGFPKGFAFEGTFDGIFKQIGEAVPPLFSASIAAGLFLELVSKNKSNSKRKQNQRTILEPVSNSYSSVIAGIKMSRGGKKDALLR